MTGREAEAQASPLPRSEFWKLISAAGGDTSGPAVNVDLTQRIDALLLQLSSQGPGRVISWMQTFVAVAQEINTGRHYDAAELAFGGLTGDDYSNVRCSITLLGREVFSEFLSAPDSLASHLDLNFSHGDDFLAGIHRSYRSMTGREMWEDAPDVSIDSPCQGDRIAPDDFQRLRTAFPGLWHAVQPND